MGSSRIAGDESLWCPLHAVLGQMHGAGHLQVGASFLCPSTPSFPSSRHSVVSVHCPGALSSHRLRPPRDATQRALDSRLRQVRCFLRPPAQAPAVHSNLTAGARVPACCCRCSAAAAPLSFHAQLLSCPFLCLPPPSSLVPDAMLPRALLPNLSIAADRAAMKWGKKSGTTGTTGDSRTNK